jgi:hypothetical protein
MSTQATKQEAKITFSERLQQLPGWVKLGVIVVVALGAIVGAGVVGNGRYLSLFANPSIFFATQKQQALNDLKAQGITPDDPNPEMYYVHDAKQLEGNTSGKVQDSDYVLLFNHGKQGYIYRADTGEYIGKMNFRK